MRLIQFSNLERGRCAFLSSAPSAVLFLFGGTLPLETLPLRGQMAEQKAEKEGEVAQETLMSLGDDATSPGGSAAHCARQAASVGCTLSGLLPVLVGSSHGALPSIVKGAGKAVMTHSEG